MKYDSRKYVDLIRKAEGKWANWDPPIPRPEVGDYGTVNRETGAFEKEGSIYDATFAQFIPNLKETYPPQEATEVHDIIIKSGDARQFDLTVGPEIEIPGIAEASIKGKWSFPTERGAVLIMVKARLSFLPPNLPLKQFVKVPELAGMCLVTEVVRTPSYAMYLSSKGKPPLFVNDGTEAIFT
ncbi:hypothetical protein FRB93_009282 [Tulasnella sp. JGI-2019a]|nr:hypothetical protein FRB93_009282 [Tulasnella sp. JGI-2019a]